MKSESGKTAETRQLQIMAEKSVGAGVDVSSSTPSSKAIENPVFRMMGNFSSDFLLIRQH